MADDAPESIVERYRREFEQAREHQRQPREPLQLQLMPCHPHPHNEVHRAARDAQFARIVEAWRRCVDEQLAAGYDPADDNIVCGLPTMLRPLQDSLDDAYRIVEQPGYEPTFEDLIVFEWDGDQIWPLEMEVLEEVLGYFWEQLSPDQVEAALIPRQRELDEARKADDAARLELANRSFHGAMCFAAQTSTSRRHAMRPPSIARRPSRCEPRRRGAGRPRMRRTAARRAAGIRSGSDPGDPSPFRPPGAATGWRTAATAATAREAWW